MRGASRGAALMEFALAWPVVLLLVLGTVEMAVWASEAAAARDAALAGARAGTVAGGGVDVATRVTSRVMSAGLVGVNVSAWCPADTRPPPTLWVCATDRGDALQVDVGGSEPSVVPLFPGRGLPVHAHVVLNKEKFVR